MYIKSAIRTDEEAETLSAERGTRHAAKEADREITNFPQSGRPECTDSGFKLFLTACAAPHKPERTELICLLQVAKSASPLVAEYSFSRRARCSLRLTGSVLPGILAVLC